MTIEDYWLNFVLPKKGELLRAYSLGATESALADLCGLRVAIWRLVIKERPLFEREMRQAKAQALSLAREKLWGKALGGEEIRETLTRKNKRGEIVETVEKVKMSGSDSRLLEKILTREGEIDAPMDTTALEADELNNKALRLMAELGLKSRSGKELEEKSGENSSNLSENGSTTRLEEENG